MATIGVYRTYNFLDKDPVIDKIKTLLKDEGVGVGEAHILSNVADTTLRNWFDGPTRKPQHATIMSVVTALGYDITFEKQKDIDLKRELKIAADWLLKQNDKPKSASKKKRRNATNGHPTKTSRR